MTATVEEQLCFEIKTILLAGHETSAAMLTWTLLELTRNPECLQKVSAAMLFTKHWTLCCAWSGMAQQVAHVTVMATTCTCTDCCECLSSAISGSRC